MVQYYSEPVGNIRKIKESITVQAPVELCYQVWSEPEKFPQFMERIIDFCYLIRPRQEEGGKDCLRMPNVLKALGAHAPLLHDTIRHFQLEESDAKVYQFENKVVMEIPNRFLATASADSDDFALNTSVQFCPADDKETTRIEFTVSYWDTDTVQVGTMTKLAKAILNEGNDFLRACLADFKRHVEAEYLHLKETQTEDPR